MRRRIFTGLAALSMLLCGQIAGAAEWHHGAAERHGGSAEQAARSHLDGRLDLGSVDLVHRNTLAVGAQHRTVRYVQRHAGLPVIGASAAVLVAPDGRIVVAVTDVARNLKVSPQPKLDIEDARTAVEGWRGDAIGLAPRTELAVLAAPWSKAGTLVWRVDVPSADGGWRYLVDAVDGRLLHERPLAVDVLGRVYPISATVTPTTQDLELTDLVVATPQHLNGWSGNLTVTNYASGDPYGQGDPLVLEQVLEPNSGEDFLYDPPVDQTDVTDGFAQVGVYYHLTRARDYFRDNLSVDMTAASWGLVAVANMQESGQPMNNAFFSQEGFGAPFAQPNLMAIGQGTIDFSDDSDVFVHEFGHYVSHNAVGYNEGQGASSEWGLSPWGGSIDEGISDYFACSLNGDHLLGEASLGQISSARDLSDTSKVCPDDIVGEVHFDGEVIGSLTWSLREAFDQAAADELVWGAVSLLTTGSSFGDFGRALQTVADTMLGTTLTQDDLDTLDALLVARGLDECDPELPLRADEPRTIQMFGLDLLGMMFNSDCATVKSFGLELMSLFHFRVTPDPSDEALRFVVDVTPEVNGELTWSIYVRAGQHVGIETSSGPIPFPTVAEYDYVEMNITDDSGEIVIDERSDPPFDPNTTYHMLIGHQNCPNTRLVVSTNSTPVEYGGMGGMGGAGGSGGAPAVEEPIEVDDGCGCHLVGAEQRRTEGLWAALLLGLALVRVSRRRG